MSLFFEGPLVTSERFFSEILGLFYCLLMVITFNLGLMVYLYLLENFKYS